MPAQKLLNLSYWSLNTTTYQATVLTNRDQFGILHPYLNSQILKTLFCR